VLDLGHILEVAELARWRVYETLYQAGRRREVLDALARFVDAVKRYPGDRRARFVDSLCRQTVDVGRTDLLRQPLLIEVLSPALRRGREGRVRGYAKRIAKLGDRIFGLHGGPEALGLMPEMDFDDLLREAGRSIQPTTRRETC
jgi:hypothetical protein